MLARFGFPVESLVVTAGDGAVRHRSILEANGGLVPPDGDPRHLPRAVLHASLATAFGPADALEPIYVRAPDAERWAR